jgi:hypothetical protein
MKLYTEKQVVNAIQITVMDKPITYAEVLEKLTPIELPSDKEIEKEWDNNPLIMQESYVKGIKDGAKWLLKQIKQQDNG